MTRSARAKKATKKKRKKRAPSARRQKTNAYSPFEIFLAVLGAAILVVIGGVVITSLF